MKITAKKYRNFTWFTASVLENEGCLILWGFFYPKREDYWTKTAWYCMHRENSKKLLNHWHHHTRRPEYHSERTRKDKQLPRFVKRTGETMESSPCGGWRTWYHISQFEILPKENWYFYCNIMLAEDCHSWNCLRPKNSA